MSRDDTLRAEIASLRRQVRALAVLLVLALVLAGSALWRGRPRPAPSVIDEHGALRGQSLYLGEDMDRPYVRLKDLHDGGGLILGDREGRGRAQLVASPDGGRLSLGSGPPGLVLDSRGPAPSILVRDERGRDRILLDGGAPRIVLFDEKGRERLRLSAGDGAAGVFLGDSAGRERGRLAVEAGAAYLRLFDAAGRRAFEAPARGP